MLKARIVISGIADESRYLKAAKLMSTAIDLVSGRLPEETLAEYLFDYAVLLTDAGQQRNELRHGTNMEPHGRSLYALGKTPSRAFL